MDINWSWDTKTEILNEQLPADTLDREKYASFLYEICAARGEKSNLVVNINAEWGAGKTYFTKRLTKSISDYHPTVYIDAWKEDYSDDPLLTIFSSIKNQLTDQSDKFTTLLNKTIENIGPLLKTATPVLLEGLVKKLTGIDDISSLTKDLTSTLLDLHSEKSKKVEAIRCGLGCWVRYLHQNDGFNKKLPLFIIIDELDRCRPDFAISLLEITKHIFNIPGVVFIIATDTEQLQHSIKVIYGIDFSAYHYLSRFFDRRFLLPSPKVRELLITKTNTNIISNFSNLKKLMAPSPPDFESFIDNCASILESFKINLRDSIKIYDRLIDLIITTKKDFDPNLMVILLSINFKYYNVYSHLKHNDLSSIKSITSEINLAFDLSYTTTGVNYLKRKNGYFNNNYTTKEKEATIKDYIELSFSILKNQNKRPINSQQSDIPEDWLNSYLNDDGYLSTYLKMGYAYSRVNKSGLNIEQYYDLIELSTTFE